MDWFDAIPDPWLLLDSERICRAANEAACRQLDQPVGRPFASLAWDPDRFELREWSVPGGRAVLLVELSTLSRFRAIMEQSPLSIQILSPEGRTVAVNRAWETLWGITLEDVAEYNVRQDPQLVELGLAPYIERGFGGETVRIPARPYNPNITLPVRSVHDDPTRWVRAYLYPIKRDGQVVEAVLIHEDITAQHLMEEELRETASRLRLALAAAGAGAWSWNVETDALTLSERAAEIFGVSHTASITWTGLSDLLHPEDGERTRLAVAEALEKRTQYDTEYRVQLADGGYRWVSAQGFGEYDDSGSVLAMQGLVQDVSSKKRMEQELREKVEALAEADQRKNEFLAMLSHELRNPLAPIRTAVEILRRKQAEPEAVWATDVMVRQLEHMTRLVDDLLEGFALSTAFENQSALNSPDAL